MSELGITEELQREFEKEDKLAAEMTQKQLEIHDKAEEIKTEMGLLEKQKKLSRKPPLVRHDFLSDTGSHFDVKEVDR